MSACGIIPCTRPRLSSAELWELLPPEAKAHDFNRVPLLAVGIPGYYGSMGQRPGNERGIYDDAIFLITESVFAAFNGNTDPSRYRKGQGTGAGKGMARLKAGYYVAYSFDKHRGKYLAICQRRGKVTVIRDGSPDYEDTGMFGINIHCGSTHHTSSEGCQTIPPSQWDAFMNLATTEAARIKGSDWMNETRIAYALLNPLS